MLATIVAARRLIGRRLLVTLAAVALLALVYTGPWDSAIIRNGVWSYGPHQVVGLVAGKVPIEEYTFYLLQVFLTGLLALLIARRVRG